MCNPYVGDRASLQLTESGPRSRVRGRAAALPRIYGAEKVLAANYASGDVVVFHRTCKRLGIERARNGIAAMEANHPHLTARKNFYVETSRARDRAELAMDDAARLREQLEAVTDERVSAPGGNRRGVAGRPDTRYGGQ